MHEAWDPVMLEVYLREIATDASGENAIKEASGRRRAVLSRTLTEVAGGPIVDLRRSTTAIDLDFD